MPFLFRSRIRLSLIAWQGRRGFPPEAFDSNASFLLKHSSSSKHAMGQRMPAAHDVDLQNLSSNWKKLQRDLDKNDKKRKAAEGEALIAGHGAKRPKPQSEERAHSRMNGGKPKMKEDQTKQFKNKTTAPSASLAIWAADNDIPAKALAAAYGTNHNLSATPSAQALEDKINEGLSTTAEAGKYIAIDCEMVGVGPNPDDESALARVSIVNFHGHQLYDSFVLPKEAVTDYRTKVSGITPQLLQGARSLEVVQADVAKLLDGKILIGHSVRKDLNVMLLGHPHRDLRDTSRYPAFRKLAAGRTPGLKKLAKLLLGIDIQGGEHSSIEDARAAMLLFRKEKEGFDREHLSKWGASKKQPELMAEEKRLKTKEKRKKKKNSKKKAKN